jgi:hypothetical protein
MEQNSRLVEMLWRCWSGSDNLPVRCGKIAFYFKNATGSFAHVELFDEAGSIALSAKFNHRLKLLKAKISCHSWNDICKHSGVKNRWLRKSRNIKMEDKYVKAF